MPTAEELEHLARAMEAKKHPVPLLFQDLAIVCDVGDDNKVRDLLLKYPTVGTALGDLLLQQGGLGDVEERVAKRAAERVEAIRRDADRPFRPGDMARDIAAETPKSTAEFLAALADKLEGAALRWLHDNADRFAFADVRDALTVVQQARALRPSPAVDPA